MTKPIILIGGGLAGLTLGIGLRRRGVPVTLWEAGHYPRHRVCGEFISGRGQASLARLGLRSGIDRAGARLATSAAFFDGPRALPARLIPQSALMISRFALDDLLAREFQRLGGELRSGQRWQGGFGPGIVRASGRRAEASADDWRLFGLKAHAHEVALSADLELHFLPSGYVGLCRLADGRVNVCGLFRSEAAVPHLAQRWREWLRGPADSILHARLASAQWDAGSFCSVAGLSLRPQQAMDRDECSIGDALTMIPPLTGNGMSMAFESAELAIEPLLQFSQGASTWAQAQQEIARACDRQFTQRLRWASRLQQALFHTPSRATLFFLTRHSEWLWRQAFESTR